MSLYLACPILAPTYAAESPNDAAKKVFLILDNLRVHHSKPVKKSFISTVINDVKLPFETVVVSKLIELPNAIEQSLNSRQRKLPKKSH